MKTIAVVLAGGSGRRVGGQVPKQLLPLGGRPVLVWSVETMEAAAGVDELIVVANPAYRSEVEGLVAGLRLSKPLKVVEGGTTRVESVANALDAIKETEANVLIHDAARPLVSQSIISNVCCALEKHQAVGVALKMVDTVWQARAGKIAACLDRSLLWRAQTPQAFRLSLLRQAHRAAAADPDFEDATDDCGLVGRYCPNAEIYIVEGEERNMKLTYPGDLSLLEALISG